MVSRSGGGSDLATSHVDSRVDPRRTESLLLRDSARWRGDHRCVAITASVADCVRDAPGDRSCPDRIRLQKPPTALKDDVARPGRRRLLSRLAVAPAWCRHALTAALAILADRDRGCNLLLVRAATAFQRLLRLPSAAIGLPPVRRAALDVFGGPPGGLHIQGCPRFLLVGGHP